MDGKRTKPSAGKDCGQVAASVRQPQRHPRARTHAPSAQPCGEAQHAVLEGAPVQRASSVGHGRCLRVQLGPCHQRAQRARISRSIGFPHQNSSISADAIGTFRRLHGRVIRAACLTFRNRQGYPRHGDRRIHLDRKSVYGHASGLRCKSCRRSSSRLVAEPPGRGICLRSVRSPSRFYTTRWDGV
jgi:hypothetical protein